MAQFRYHEWKIPMFATYFACHTPRQTNQSIGQFDKIKYCSCESHLINLNRLLRLYVSITLPAPYQQMYSIHVLVQCQIVHNASTFNNYYFQANWLPLRAQINMRTVKKKKSNTQFIWSTQQLNKNKPKHAESRRRKEATQKNKQKRSRETTKKKAIGRKYEAEKKCRINITSLKTVIKQIHQTNWFNILTIDIKVMSTWFFFSLFFSYSHRWCDWLPQFWVDS